MQLIDAMACQAVDDTTDLANMGPSTEIQPTQVCGSIKLGNDAHAKWYYVSGQIDGATPIP